MGGAGSGGSGAWGSGGGGGGGGGGGASGSGGEAAAGLSPRAAAFGGPGGRAPVVYNADVVLLTSSLPPDYGKLAVWCSACRAPYGTLELWSASVASYWVPSGG